MIQPGDLVVARGVVLSGKTTVNRDTIGIVVARVNFDQSSVYVLFNSPLEVVELSSWSVVQVVDAARTLLEEDT